LAAVGAAAAELDAGAGNGTVVVLAGAAEVTGGGAADVFAGAGAEVDGEAD